jgi:hypothetical protein
MIGQSVSGLAKRSDALFKKFERDLDPDEQVCPTKSRIRFLSKRKYAIGQHGSHTNPRGMSRGDFRADRQVRCYFKTINVNG